MIGLSGTLKLSNGTAYDCVITALDGNFYCITTSDNHSVYVNSNHIVEFGVKSSSSQISESIHERWKSAFGQ